LNLAEGEQDMHKGPKKKGPKKTREKNKKRHACLEMASVHKKRKCNVCYVSEKGNRYAHFF